MTTPSLPRPASDTRTPAQRALGALLAADVARIDAAAAAAGRTAPRTVAQMRAKLAAAGSAR